jgi:hypothetical protein
MNIIVRMLLALLCIMAVLFGLELYALRGGWLHNAVVLFLVYFGCIGFHKLDQGWKP